METDRTALKQPSGRRAAFGARSGRVGPGGPRLTAAVTLCSG